MDAITLDVIVDFIFNSIVAGFVALLEGVVYGAAAAFLDWLLEAVNVLN
ncbi:MAG: hypothetical protein HYV26_10145 [Candidatus Hydrogenedentes bacterium]|nr:hypothetical protein [Candidatus Hydrogenedentota bacterium]